MPDTVLAHYILNTLSIDKNSIKNVSLYSPIYHWWNRQEEVMSFAKIGSREACLGIVFSEPLLIRCLWPLDCYSSSPAEQLPLVQWVLTTFHLHLVQIWVLIDLSDFLDGTRRSSAFHCLSSLGCEVKASIYSIYNFRNQSLFYENDFLLYI